MRAVHLTVYAGESEEQRTFFDRSVATKIARSLRRKGIRARVSSGSMQVCCHCKISADGRIAQSWVSRRKHTEIMPSHSLAHNGQINFFGASFDSPEEAERLARAAYLNFKRAA